MSQSSNGTRQHCDGLIQSEPDNVEKPFHQPLFMRRTSASSSSVTTTLDAPRPGEGGRGDAGSNLDPALSSHGKYRRKIMEAGGIEDVSSHEMIEVFSR